MALASGEGTYTEEVREAQLHTGVPNVKCVDAKGLPLEQDGLHLTTPAQVRLGEMLAHAYLRFTPTSSLRSNDAPASISSFVSYFLIIGQIFRCLWMIITFR